MWFGKNALLDHLTASKMDEVRDTHRNEYGRNFLNYLSQKFENSSYMMTTNTGCFFKRWVKVLPASKRIGDSKFSGCSCPAPEVTHGEATSLGEA